LDNVQTITQRHGFSNRFVGGGVGQAGDGITVEIDAVKCGGIDGCQCDALDVHHGCLAVTGQGQRCQLVKHTVPTVNGRDINLRQNIGGGRIKIIDAIGQSDGDRFGITSQHRVNICSAFLCNNRKVNRFSTSDNSAGIGIADSSNVERSSISRSDGSCRRNKAGGNSLKGASSGQCGICSYLGDS